MEDMEEMKYAVSIDISNFRKGVKELQQSLTRLVDSNSKKELKLNTDSLKKSLESINKDTKKSIDTLKKNLQEKLPTPKVPKIGSNKGNTQDKVKNVKTPTIGNIADTLGLAVASQQIVSFGTTAVKVFAQMDTQIKNLDFTFGKYSNNVKTFIAEQSGALGMAESDIAKYANLYGSTLKSITQDEQQASRMTQEYIKLTSLLSTKTGYDIQTVAESVKSGLMGETESIDKLGVEVKAKILETTDAFKQLSNGRPWEKLSFNEQQQVIMMGILEQATKKYGNAIEENAVIGLNRLSANLTDAKNNLLSFVGQGLTPITTLLSFIAVGFKQFTTWLNSLNSETKMIITGIGMFVSGIILLVTALSVGSTAMAFFGRGISIINKAFPGMIAKMTLVAPYVFAIVGVLLVLSNVFGGLANVVKNFGAVVVATFKWLAGNVVVAIGWLVSFIGSIFGGSMQKLGNSIVSSGQAMINSAKATAQAIRGTSGEMNKAGANANKQQLAMNKSTDANDKNADSAKKAAKANKQLADNLQGFDEINKLVPDDKGSAGDSAGGPNKIEAPSMPAMSGLDTGGITTGMDSIKTSFDGVITKIKEFMPWIVTLGALFVGFKLVSFISSLGTVGKALGSLGSGFGTVIKFMANPIFIGISLIITGIAVAIKGFIEYLENPTWSAFGKMLAGLVAVIAGVAIAFGTAAAGVVAIIAVIALIAVVIYKNWDTISAFLVGIAQWIYDNVLVHIINFFVSAWDMIKGVVEAVISTILNVVKGIIDFVKMVLTTVWNLYVTYWTFIFNVVKGVIDLVINVVRTIVDFIKNILIMVWNLYVTYWTFIFNTVKGAIDMIFDILGAIANWVMQNVVSPIANFFKGLWDGIVAIFSGVVSFFKGVFTGAWEGIKAIFSGVSGFFKGVWNSIVSIFTNVGTAVSNAVGGTFKSVVNTILGFAENTINGFIRSINGAVGMINKIPGVNISTISELKIPRLAKGGVVSAGSGGTIAQIGEGKYDEAVVPLGNSPQFRSMKEEIVTGLIEAMVPILEEMGGTQENRGPAKAQIELTGPGGVSFAKTMVNLAYEYDEVF